MTRAPARQSRPPVTAKDRPCPCYRCVMTRPIPFRARAHVGAQSGVRGRARVAVARRKPAGAVTRRAGAQEILRRVGGEPLGDAYVRQYQDLYGGCTYTR